jgi:peptidoglycan/xylan/chitin deacetylase (PgdA/CDA1 family)
VGTPRLVTLFDRLQIPTTWFIPGSLRGWVSAHSIAERVDAR